MRTGRLVVNVIFQFQGAAFDRLGPPASEIVVQVATAEVSTSDTGHAGADAPRAGRVVLQRGKLTHPQNRLPPLRGERTVILSPQFTQVGRQYSP